ncbi:MAG: anhydro-N-acetylmuramic acid kinase [Alphaproteobacteria bacterium]|nr:anhydro-N-acetylmuramic acid kinase [Alphaproteobacteria bacterium]
MKQTKKYRIIGNMTGNSMDAIDLILTEFEGNNIKDICTYTKPYDKDMQIKINTLRQLVHNKTAEQIRQIPEFLAIHNEYIRQIAECVKELCYRNKQSVTSIDAIGFHGKTLDHNPPSKAKEDGSFPYTLQMGSGQMLADLTAIPVVYDFRSDWLMAGYEGAPLVPPHNAHIAEIEGDGIYYNGGNTANFALIRNKQVIASSDAGPFNEYIDGFVRQNTTMAYDQQGIMGKNGQLDINLLQKTFKLGRKFYDRALPKSGDPAYYQQDKLFHYVQQEQIRFEDALHTFEYFAAYIAAYTLTQIPENIIFPENIILFGGGWKNPIVYQSFTKMLKNQAQILPEHQEAFKCLYQKLPSTLEVHYSQFGAYMEARLFADLAYHKLINKPWKMPETDTPIVCGIIAKPSRQQQSYPDCINRAAKGWQKNRVK